MSDTPSAFTTIKALVLDFVRRAHGIVDYERLTQEVKARFPDSEWKRSHWAWYKNQILHGRFQSEFDEPVLKSLANGKELSIAPKPETSRAAKTVPAEPTKRAGIRGAPPLEPKAKSLGDPILAQVRESIRAASAGNEYILLRINRWVHSRLLLDEREMKRGIKLALIRSTSGKCGGCGKESLEGKYLELHRINPKQGYVEGNCELLCKPCHKQREPRRNEIPEG